MYKLFKLIFIEYINIIRRRSDGQEVKTSRLGISIAAGTYLSMNLITLFNFAFIVVTGERMEPLFDDSLWTVSLYLGGILLTGSIVYYTASKDLDKYENGTVFISTSDEHATNVFYQKAIMAAYLSVSFAAFVVSIAI